MAQEERTTPRQRHMLQEHFEEEFLQELRTYAKEEALIKRLEALYERSCDEQETLLREIQQAYKAVPRRLEHISQVTGEQPLVILQAIARVATFYDSKKLPWTLLLDIIQTYEVQLQQIKEGK